MQCDVGPLTLETWKRGATGKRGFSPYTVDSGEGSKSSIEQMGWRSSDSDYSSFVSGAGGQREFGTIPLRRWLRGGEPEPEQVGLQPAPSIGNQNPLRRPTLHCNPVIYLLFTFTQDCCSPLPCLVHIHFRINKACSLAGTAPQRRSLRGSHLIGQSRPEKLIPYTTISSQPSTATALDLEFYSWHIQSV